MIGTTAVKPVLKLLKVEALPHRLHRDRILYTFEQLPRVERQDAPMFVFAHILACHSPFVFAEDGGPITPAQRRSDLLQTRYAREVESYRRQLVYINRLVERAIGEIIARSPDAVIVVQGDHGSGARFDFNSIEKTYLKERMTILNAIRMPGPPAGPAEPAKRGSAEGGPARPEGEVSPGTDESRRQLYPSITPVNTFRVIFNRYFGTNYELLEDRSYFTLGIRVFQFIDVTDKIGD